MARQGQSITLSLNPTDKAKLEQLAAEFGMTWGENPNISKLVKASAHSELRIAPNHDWHSGRIDALEIARQVLIDADKNLEAQEIAKLLWERSELKIPLKYKLQIYFPVLINEAASGYPLVLQLRAGNSHSGKGVAGILRYFLSQFLGSFLPLSPDESLP